MDKYNLVLDIIGHPERYSADRLKELLSDPETREIYNILCKTASAAESNRQIDVDEEWENFSRSYSPRQRRLFSWFGSRAASITAIVGTSLAAVAAGVAVTVAVTGRIAGPAADPHAADAVHVAGVARNTSETVPDSVRVAVEPVMFEDAALEVIMKAIADVYNVGLIFDNKDAAALHLYYKFDPALPLDDVISQLNTFEQINITLKENTLTID